MKKIFSFSIAFFLAFYFLFFDFSFSVSASTADIFLPPDNSDDSLIVVDSSVDTDYYNDISLQYIDIYKKVVSEIRENIIFDDDFSYNGSRHQAFIPFIDVENYSCEFVVTNGEMIWFLNDSGQLRLKCSSTGYSYVLYSVGLDKDYNYMNYMKSVKSNDAQRFPGTTEIIFLPEFYDIAYDMSGSIINPVDNTIWALRYRTREEIEAIKLDFLEWFYENDKIDYFVENGLLLTNDYIDFLYDWYAQYGGSVGSVLVGLPKLISKCNIISWDIELAKRLVNCFEQLMYEYDLYLKNLAYEAVQVTPDAMPHWRDNKDLIDNSDDDTTVISLLREILRVLINLPNDLKITFSNIDVYFDGLFFNFNNLFNFLNNLPSLIAEEIELNFIDFDFGTKFKVFFDDLQIGIKSDLEYLLIPTAEPFTELKEDIYLKLPVLNQLTGLPNFDGYLETDENTPETLSAYGSVSSDKTLSMFNVSFYDTSVYNGVSFDIVDFTKWQKAIDAFKGICSVVIIFHFVHWLIAFIPKLLSGYNSSN